VETAAARAAAVRAVVRAVGERMAEERVAVVAGVWVERTVVVWVEAGKAVREAVLVERAAAATGLVASAAASEAI
jgi:hypothetical protein